MLLLLAALVLIAYAWVALRSGVTYRSGQFGKRAGHHRRLR